MGTPRGVRLAVLDRALVSPAAEPVAAPVVDLADRSRRFPELFNRDTAVHDSDELERE